MPACLNMHTHIKCTHTLTRLLPCKTTGTVMAPRETIISACTQACLCLDACILVDMKHGRRSDGTHEVLGQVNVSVRRIAAAGSEVCTCMCVPVYMCVYVCNCGIYIYNIICTYVYF